MAVVPVRRVAGELTGRFTRTPLKIHITFKGLDVCLETNSDSILQSARRLTQRRRAVSLPKPEFVWRVVCDPETKSEPRWPRMEGLCVKELGYVQFGKYAFIAVDSKGREAIAFLPEDSAQDETGLGRFFDTLFNLSTGWLKSARFPPASTVLVSEKMSRRNHR